MFKDWFPNVTEASVFKPITPGRGLYQCKQSMPWPVWPRDMTFTATGMFDHQRGGGVLSCIKSVDVGSKYFGANVPDTADGHVRIDIKRGYHYFQRISDTQTRYITIFNSDPQLSYTPTWLMNFMMTKICYQMLVLIQEKSKDVPNSEFGKRMIEKKELYDKYRSKMDAAWKLADEAKALKEANESN